MPKVRVAAVPMPGLIRLRKAKGLTLMQLGSKSELDVSHLRKIELGEIRLDVVRARMIARVLDCAIEDLF